MSAKSLVVQRQSAPVRPPHEEEDVGVLHHGDEHEGDAGQDPNLESKQSMIGFFIFKIGKIWYDFSLLKSAEINSAGDESLGIFLFQLSARSKLVSLIAYFHVRRAGHVLGQEKDLFGSESKRVRSFSQIREGVHPYV